MCPPAKATHNVTGIAFHSKEGRIERCAAYSVKDNVEPCTTCHVLYIFLNGRRTVIDWDGPEALRYIFLVRRDCREDFGAVSARKLNRNVANSARTSVNQHFVICTDTGTVYKCLPSCDRH